MESWQANVDRRLKQSEDDLRGLVWKGIVAVVALAGLTGGLYLYVGSQDSDLGRRLSNVETTVGRLDERTIAMQKQMDGMDAKLDKLLAK